MLDDRDCLRSLDVNARSFRRPKPTCERHSACGSDLISGYRERSIGLPRSALPVGTVPFMGALDAIGGIRPARHFEMVLEAPVLGRDPARLRGARPAGGRVSSARR